MNHPELRRRMMETAKALKSLGDYLSDCEAENGSELPVAEWDFRRIAEDLETAIRDWEVRNPPVWEAGR